jgi:hypothetical protein
MALQSHLEELCHLRQLIAKLNHAIVTLAQAE